MGRVVAGVLILFCGARLFFFHGWSEAAREKTWTCAHDESSQSRSLTMWVSASARVRVRVAPQGGMGPSLRAPCACRVVICELMSSERAQWLFVFRFSWWWVGRCMDTPMCVPDFCCLLKESVTSTDMLRTSRVPASSVCAKILVAFARRIMLKAHRAAETCERGPTGPSRSCSKMSRTAKIRNVGCLPMSMVTCSRKCIDRIRPGALGKAQL